MEIEEGRLQYDPATRAADGRVVVDLTSATTGNERRDEKMHEKILETGRYPQAVFTVERMTGAYNAIGRSDLQVHGTLDIHGATHPVTFPAEVRTENDRVTARGHLTIPYVEWGLDDPSFLVFRVAKTVDVTLEVAGTLRPSPVPGRPGVQSGFAMKKPAPHDWSSRRADERPVEPFRPTGGTGWPSPTRTPTTSACRAWASSASTSWSTGGRTGRASASSPTAPACRSRSRAGARSTSSAASPSRSPSRRTTSTSSRCSTGRASRCGARRGARGTR